MKGYSPAIIETSNVKSTFTLELGMVEKCDKCNKNKCTCDNKNK